VSVIFWHLASGFWILAFGFWLLTLSLSHSRCVRPPLATMFSRACKPVSWVSSGLFCNMCLLRVRASVHVFRWYLL
jgi:hypothetical protein